MCEALQIPFRSKALPLVTRCPLCTGGSLHLFNDNISEGVWHHCRDCGSSGDLVELAMAIWEVPAHTALIKLSEAGVDVPEDCLRPDTIASYVYNYPQYRNRMANLWEAAKGHYLNSKSRDVDGIRRHYGLQLTCSPDRWAAGPGLLVGAIHKSYIEKAFHPSVGTVLASVVNGNTSAFRVFKGQRWEEVMVAPFYDLPDRIRAFSFLGRRGRMPKDSVFRRLTAHHDHEAGLFGVAAVPMAGSVRHVIAVDSWLFALQLQMRNFRTSMRALPVVAWHDDGIMRTKRAWEMFADRQVIFWSFDMNAKTLTQAVDCEGHISLLGPEKPDRESIQHYLRLKPMQDLERSIVRHAKPWPEALKAWMASAPDGKIDDLMVQLEQAGADVSAILRRIGNKELSVPVPKLARSVKFGSWLITEQNDAWYANGKGFAGRREMLNAILRLTHAIKDNASGEVWYRGFIRYKGTELPFIERVLTVQKNTAAWVQEKLMDAGLGVAAWHANMVRHIHQVAVLFNEPEFVKDDLYKWVQKLREEQAHTQPEKQPT